MQQASPRGFGDERIGVGCGRSILDGGDSLRENALLAADELVDFSFDVALTQDPLASEKLGLTDEDKNFNGVLDEHPNIARQLISNLAGRVRKLTADVKSLALQDVYGRVANVLMDLSEERGDGTLYIPEKLTQQDIADRVGASREMVARILKDLTIGEYIRFEGRHIIINTRLPAKY